MAVGLGVGIPLGLLALAGIAAGISFLCAGGVAAGTAAGTAAGAAAVANPAGISTSNLMMVPSASQINPVTVGSLMSTPIYSNGPTLLPQQTLLAPPQVNAQMTSGLRINNPGSFIGSQVINTPTSRIL